MSGPQKVTGAALRRVLEETGGNVTEAARRVGIAPVNLRKRLPGIGIELAALRAEGTARSVRISAELFAQLREAKFDLQHKLRVDLDEAAVLAMFAREALAEWLKAKAAS